MRLFTQALALAVVGTGLVATPSAAALGGVAAVRTEPSPVQRLRAHASGSVTISREPATGRVGFVEVGRNGDLLPDSDAAPVAKAAEFLSRHAQAFGAPADQLVRDSVRRDELGTTVTYIQEYRGVPVFGTMLRVHLDPQGDLTSANGEVVPVDGLAVEPRLSVTDAEERAVGAVRADPPGDDGAARTEELTAAASELVVYREGLVRGVPGESVLAYQVEVTNEANVRDMVYLDAQTGKLVNRYSLVHDALDRRLYEYDDQQDPPATSLVWQEGDAFPGTLSGDQANIVAAAGETYWLFRNAFGRDSYDGSGAPLVSVNNAPISCPNAVWNGVFTLFCDGVSSDDVVAHEWGHAYTNYTHDLIYQWQPGALNESYSDIWGETVDLINGRQDDDEGDLSTVRPAGQCSSHSTARVELVVHSPDAIAKTCPAAPASFGPALDQAGVRGDVVLALDPADPAGPGVTDACTPIVNAADVAGNVALVDRGTCAFAVKVRHAQDAGAVAVIVGNDEPGPPFGLAGADESITIPSVMVGLSDRNLIAGALGETVDVTMRHIREDRVDSYRWLLSEDSPALGGAIRDMWSPTCYGHPGKVSDAEYRCGTGDAGGVHSNSGVPNHGFALLVDGGEYNGFVIPALGLTKAAHLYYRAMTAYQTPSSDFADHADSLDASCSDLVGRPLNALSTEAEGAEVSGEVIESTDCAAVSAMAAAVELRDEPVQCNFQPLLAQDIPRLCEGNRGRTFFRESFGDGATGWTIESASLFGGPTDPWELTTRIPGGRRSHALFAADPVGGSCALDANDLSGRTTATGPAVVIPDLRGNTTRLSFLHYVATERGYDGGNVKLSVNGGAFEVVPAEAYLANAPGQLATVAQRSTNPLAGEPGFSGSDGGEVTGSWGESQIDLSMLGVSAGDEVRVRFDFGRDGCGGNHGWYVDRVKLKACFIERPDEEPSAGSRRDL